MEGMPALLLDVHSLCLAVREASELFRVLTDQDPRQVLRDYIKHLTTTRPDWSSALQCQAFTSPHVTPHCSLDWFMLSKLPLLQEVMDNTQVKALMHPPEGVESQAHAKQVAKGLGINPDLSYELLVAAACLRECGEVVGEHNSSRREAFLRHASGVFDHGTDRSPRLALKELAGKFRRLPLASLISLIEFSSIENWWSGNKENLRKVPGGTLASCQPELDDGPKAKKRRKDRKKNDSESVAKTLKKSDAGAGAMSPGRRGRRGRAGSRAQSSPLACN